MCRSASVVGGADARGIGGPERFCSAAKTSSIGAVLTTVAAVESSIMKVLPSF